MLRPTQQQAAFMSIVIYKIMLRKILYLRIYVVPLLGNSISVEQLGT
jgi:hypothetical protein